MSKEYGLMNADFISEEFIKRWEHFYGKPRTKLIASHLRNPDPRIITPNSLKIRSSDLKRQLEKKGFKLTKIEDLRAFIVETEPFNIVSTPEYLAGFFSIQALSSQFPTRCLEPSQNTIVVDMTASPGIKTCFLAQEMKNNGSILALEISKSRIPALKANISRMGVNNAIILNFDATKFDKLNIQVDHVLLDAPCSGTGLKLSKNKRLKPRILDDIYRQAKRQKLLLESAWQQLKPNGTMIYSICSLEPEEGEIQINNFLKRHEEDVDLLSLPISSGFSGADTKWNNSSHPQLRETRRFFPKPGVDGFFMALVHKRLN